MFIDDTCSSPQKITHLTQLSFFGEIEKHLKSKLPFVVFRHPIETRLTAFLDHNQSPKPKTKFVVSHFESSNHFSIYPDQTLQTDFRVDEIPSQSKQLEWNDLEQKQKNHTSLIIKAIGVTTKKNTIPITIGAIKLPKSIPNLNQTLFRGESNFELNRPNTKKIPDIDKDHNLNSFCLSKGHKAIIKKTIEKTIPKFLFVGSFIFCCINYFTIFLSKPKAFISSFHSLLESPD